MVNFVKKLISIFLLFFAATLISGPAGTTLDGPVAEFAESFVSHYEFNTSGRYAHEYHPLILKKTAQSMQQLEQAFSDHGFNLVGRYALMGYEENSFQSFFPRVRDCQGALIDDEASFKDPRGWCIQLHNRFGTMSGFPFRSINQASEQSSRNLFEHINPHAVEIFSQNIDLLQKHSFGQMSKTMFNLEREIYDLATQDKWRDIIGKLVSFWTALYNGEYKTGDQQVAGTQDILFSIENAKFLQKSKLELIKFFTGPDITYPIVVSKVCSANATKNAQDFIARFVKELKPIKKEPTLYVFRSFVDGVGKSTLLGNIKNWMDFKDDIDLYKITDNTSTLEAELFKFDDNVYIADLPAQMSHFTHKPNGVVWVDQRAICGHDCDTDQAVHYFVENKDTLKEKYENLVQEVQNIIVTSGTADPIFSDITRPEFGFVRNLIILKELERNSWIPFSINEQHFLGNSYDLTQVRVLTEIGKARSEGLKNVQAAQMIFTEGLMFPATYNDFVDILITQSKDLGIKNIVFVDFLSMYSRSSRENIRINYLLQLMGLIEANFDPFKTLYRNFVSNSELLAMLINPAAYQCCRDGLRLETLVRMALYKMMCEKMCEKICSAKGTRTFSESEVVSFTKDFLTKIDPKDLTNLEDIVEKKIETETDHLYKIYKDTKEFANLHNLDFELIRRFSNFLQHFFVKVIQNDALNELWDHLDGNVTSALPLEDGWVKDPNYFVNLESGTRVRLLCVISDKNRDPAVVSKILRTVRSAWYSAILNVLVANEISPDQKTIFTKEIIAQVPVLLKKDKTGRICLVEKELEFELSTDEETGQETEMRKFKDNLYLANYCYPSTAYGIFGFGADVGVNKFTNYSQGYILTSFLEYNKFGAGSNRIVNASRVWAENSRSLLNLKDLFFKERELEAKKLASKNKREQNQENDEKAELAKTLKELEDNIVNNVNSEDERDSAEILGFNLNSQDHRGKSKQHHIVIKSETLAPNFEIFARMIITLETIARDLDSPILVEPERESFFAGLKLVEEVLLGQELGVCLKYPLFIDPMDKKSMPIVDLKNDIAWR